MVQQYVVRYEDGVSGKLPVPGGGGSYRILLDRQLGGAQHFSLLVNEIQPGYTGAYHKHDVEHAWYILQGQGTMWVDDVPHEIGPNMAVFAPAGVMHRIASLGPEPLKYVVVYAPAGPEQELREKGERAYGNDAATS